MLNRNLLVSTQPQACKKNICYYRNYRITVLGDSLFRIEKNSRKSFCDRATQIVWFRNMPAVAFTSEEDGEGFKIHTERTTLCLGPTLKKSWVLLEGKQVPLTNRENLLGTYRTLDSFDGDFSLATKKKMKLGYGVTSRSGVALLDDSTSLLLTEEGTVIPRETEEEDVYVFAFGKRYREAVRALFRITGKVPMVPRFALGNWWSRYHAYSDKEYLHLLDNLEAQRIPITVGVIDMDWHWSTGVDEKKQITASGKADEWHGGADGWTGYSWNTDLFPDWKGTVRQIHDRKMKVSLNLHPASGVRYFEDMYADVAKAVGVDPKTEQVIPFDMTNDRFVNAYFDKILNPYEKEGIDFWWIDWQQGQKSAIPGLDPLWLLNHYQYQDIKDKKSPIILSRYSGIGSHRYPLGFSGDTHITWNTMKFQPYFTKTATNAGYPWWSHDVGGHYGGYKDDELFLRLLQLGVFSPITRLHCTDTITLTKEPAVFMNGTGYLAGELLRFRHRLIPFLYSANWETSHEGLALVEPLYYECPDIPEAYSLKDEYLFGRSLLCSAVTSPGKSKDKLAESIVYLPEGHWTDIFTGDEYEGGETKTMYRWMDTMPVLAREGSFIPMDARREGNDCDIPEHLEILTFNGNGTYVLHEANEKRESEIRMVSQAGDGQQKVTFVMKDALLKNRTLTFRFRNIPEGSVQVTADGEEIPFAFDDNGSVSVTVDGIRKGVTYEITVRHTTDPKTIRNRQLLYTMSRITGNNRNKEKLLYKLFEASAEEAETLIFATPTLTDPARKRLMESFIG